MVIFVNNELIARHKFRLNHKCTKKQAQQIAIVKALDLKNYLEIAHNRTGKREVYTDSRFTIDSLKNTSNYIYYIEEIKNRLIDLRSAKQTIEYSWIKGHASKISSEQAYRLAKDVASGKDIPVVFDRIPNTILHSELKEEFTLKCQKEWELCNKAAVTKQVLPNVRDRFHCRITINPNIAALVNSHVKPSRNSTDLK